MPKTEKFEIQPFAFFLKVSIDVMVKYKSELDFGDWQSGFWDYLLGNIQRTILFFISDLASTMFHAPGLWSLGMHFFLETFLFKQARAVSQFERNAQIQDEIVIRTI